jgi:thioredoxin reductase (NADPH)
MAGKIREINAAQYESEVLGSERAVLDFYSTECPPCEALASKYESLSELYGDDIKFFKIFRQENRELAESLDVTGSPTVIFYADGERVGETLTGGIKRSDLAKNLDALISDERATEIKSKIRPVTTDTDVVVLGAGPAGLTAAIYLAQAHIDTIVVDPALPGGYVATTHQVSNYPGFIESQPGFMLAHFMSEQAKAAGAGFRAAVDVTRVDLDAKEVEVDGYETLRARRIVVATGSSPRPLGLPGEMEYRGQGLSYCATCDAKYYDDKEVIVIGGGNSAIEESLFITKFASKVTVVHQFAELQANKLAQQKAFDNPKIDFLFRHEPREFIRHGADDMEVVVEDLETGERKPLRAAGVFIFVGFIPNIGEFGKKLDLDRWGYVKADEKMRTNLEGVYAVGDVGSKSYRQITTATADGTIAAIDIGKDLE